MDSYRQLQECEQEQYELNEIEMFRCLLDYDPISGNLFFKKSCGNKAKYSVAGHLRSDGYVRLQINKSMHMAHRVAWIIYYGKHPLFSIDHINGIKNDNRIVNLRDVTHRVNCQNFIKPNANNNSGKLGVGWHKASGKWTAQISDGGKKIYLGVFESLQDAESQYLEAKRRLHFGCTI
jgi:hypothetical protein